VDSRFAQSIKLAQIAYTYLLFARSISYLAHDLIGEPVSIPDQVRDRLSPDHALAGDTACCISSRYRRKPTDWLKAAFTLFLHRPFRKLRFIFDEAAGPMVKPRLLPRMNRTLSHDPYNG
jgi:hypothetical protein